MKIKFIILIFSLTFLTVSNAQVYPIEHILSDISQTRTNKVIHANGMTFVGGSSYSCNTTTVNVFDEFGEIAWEYIDDGHSWVNDMVFRASDSTLIIANFWATADDVPTTLDGPNIIGLNMDGELQFEIHLTSMDFGGVTIFGPSHTTPNLTINSVGEIIVANYHKIFWLDPVGNFVDSVNYLDFEFSKILSFNDTKLIAAANDKAVILNDVGDVEQVLEIGAPVLDFDKAGDNLFILTSDKVYIYNTLDSSLTPLDYNSLIENVEGMTMDDNSIYFWGTATNSSNKVIMQYDKSSLDYLQVIQLNQDPLEIIDIASDNIQLYVVGNKKMNSDDNIPLLNGFIKTTPVFAEPIYFGADIGLSNFNVVEPAIVSYFDSSEYFYFFENTNMVFEYDVTNFGATPVSSFSLSSQWYNGFNCVEARAFRFYDNIEILPGETITQKDSISAFETQFFNEFQLTAFAPNHKFDGDLSNNYLLGLDYILNAECTCGYRGFDLEIFPNPASDYLNIVFEAEDFSNQDKFRIVNLEGKVLNEVYAIMGRNNYSIGTKNYSNGIYFFQYLSNGAVISSEKFVVQN